MRKRTGNKDEKILKAAIKVFANEGYPNAKINDIAKLANVSVGTVYLYYLNKEELLLQILENTWNNFYKNLEEAYNQDCEFLKKLEIFTNNSLNNILENKELCLLMANEQNHLIMQKKGNTTDSFSKFYNLFLNILKEGQKKGLFDSELDMDIVFTQLFGGIRHLIYTWQKGEINATKRKISKQIILIFKNLLYNKKSK